MRDLVLTATFLLGLALIVVGVGMVYLPAGVITAGVLAVLAASGYARAASHPTPEAGE